MSAPANEAFVPLAIPPARESRAEDFRVLIAPRPENARPVQTLEPRLADGSTPSVNRTACEPRVHVQKQGDRIIGINIQCSCGQVIDLNCIYEQ